MRTESAAFLQKVREVTDKPDGNMDADWQCTERPKREREEIAIF